MVANFDLVCDGKQTCSLPIYKYKDKENKEWSLWPQDCDNVIGERNSYPDQCSGTQYSWLKKTTATQGQFP